MSQYQKSDAGSISDRENRLLLVVDSEPDHLFYTTTLLGRFNYKALPARSAEEALEITTHIVPSLIITSMSLKDMDGIELIQQLKQNPYTAAIPVIALRKQNDRVRERMSLEIGAVECLYHPVEPEVLYRVVQIVAEKTPRTYMRIRTLQPVKVNKKQSVSFESAYALDLSEHGMFLQTTEPLGRNARLSIEMDLKGHIIPVEALVVYSYRKSEGPYLQPGMGLEFVQIKLSDQKFIRDFLRSEITRDIVPGNA